MHWTRRQTGPWPDQSEEEYLDDLIFRNEQRKRGDLAALARILASQRLIATNRLSRGLCRVVCFSEIRIDQLLQNNQFRPHVGRWDFQPFGLAFDKKALKQLGAKRVVYGNEETWQQLDDADRHLFQVSGTQSGAVDWRCEKEWRLLGDLDLRKFNQDSAIVFVPGEKEAKLIASLSRWPIICVNASE